MRKILQRFQAKYYQPETIEFNAPLAIERDCALVGDIHGRDDLLDQLLQQLNKDENITPQCEVVFVGDYIDRGENAAAVLRRLHEMSKTWGGQITCLMGNHEKMLIDFLDRPGEKGRLWLRNGGLQTLASFGVGGVTEVSQEEALQKAAHAMGAALGPALERWLRALPLTYINGNLHVVHAAADPALTMPLQSQRTLLWGNKAFSQTPRSDGLWIAHGHTIVDEAKAENGRISIDTGAYYTGRLTAAVLAPEFPVRFIDTA